MASTLHYDHYKVLGVRNDASTAAIKRAYRDRVKQCHPDLDDSPGAHMRFLIVNEAYTVLSDPFRRMVFDHQLEGHRSAMNAPRSKERRQASHRERDLVSDRAVPRFAFVGLHLTGLIFGVLIVLGVMAGYTFFDWPAYIMIMGIPGLVVIPDSIEGLKMASRKSPERK